MRIAALYDVHGNLPALEAVLDELAREEVDEVVVGGDVVPGPMPRASLERLLSLELPTAFIHGNGEQDVLTVRRGREPTRVPEDFRDIVRWVADALPDEHLDAFESWPLTLRREIDGLGSVLFCHATPRNDTELFTKLTPDDALEPVLREAGADLVVCGHTHMQFDRLVGDVRVVNAGSVGMPFGTSEAGWLLLGPDGPRLRRTRYDLDAATARIRETEYPRADVLDLRRPPPEERMLDLFEAAALQ